MTIYLLFPAFCRGRRRENREDNRRIEIDRTLLLQVLWSCGALYGNKKREIASYAVHLYLMFSCLMMKAISPLSSINHCTR